MPEQKGLRNYGANVYGLAAVALGLIGLVWGDFASPWQPVPEGVPYRRALAYTVAVFFLAAGAAMQWRRTARYGAVALALLYFMAALLWLPRVVGFPRMIGTWLGFAEQFALVMAAVIVYGIMAPDHPLWAVRNSRICQLVFGLCVVSFAVAHFLALKETAGMVPGWIPPGQRFWAIATGVFHLLAGLSIISGLMAALAARLFTAMIAGFGVLVWAPLLVAQPHVHMMWGGNAMNLAIMGAAWIVADSIPESR